MKKVISIFLLISLYIPVFAITPTDSLMQVLKSELNKKAKYDNLKESKILHLRASLISTSPLDYNNRYRTCLDLFREYFNFRYDSAYVYSQKLIDLSQKMEDRPKVYESRIRMGMVLISSGMFTETFDCLAKVKPELLNDRSKMLYYDLKHRVYFALAEYNADKFHSAYDLKESAKYLDSAIALARPGTFERLIYIAQQRHDSARQGKDNLKSYKELLYNRQLSPHQEAMVATGLSSFYQGQERVRLLCIAAINDIRTSTKETLAIFRLGKELDRQGDVINAYEFLQEAMDNALFYGSRLHKVEIAAVLPYVAAKKLLITENEKNRMRSYMVSAFIIIILITAFSIIIYGQLRRLRVKEIIIAENNAQLENTNIKLHEDVRIKEKYIGYFFNLISGNIVNLEKIKRTVERKVKQKKFEDLLLLSNEIDIKQERENLFDTFDRIFLELFPNFVGSFNSLLAPDQQIWPKDKKTLTTKLRIFALMRLGITDTQTVASILESSVSTIVTYKIRIKSKALVLGDEFDESIMKIKLSDT